MENVFQPIPKQVRLVDPKAYFHAQKSYCERCGEQVQGKPHHIRTRASGGPDHPYNLIQLCGFCHYGDLPDGKISREELFNIVADREGVDVKVVIETVRRLTRGVSQL